MEKYMYKDFIKPIGIKTCKKMSKECK
jgi:hypothetical protein